MEWLQLDPAPGPGTTEGRPAASGPAARGGGVRRIRPSIAWLIGLSIVCAGLWGALLLWFQGPAAAGPRIALIAAWGLLGSGAAAWLMGRGPRPLALAWLLSLLALVGAWSVLKPSHERVWADDVARLLEAEVDGSQVTLRNVRDFDWRSETDYTPRWETRRYDLDQLATADLFLSYWMGPHIAHTLVSFGFDDGQQLVFSLEIRKERGERFSALGGFYRKFEQVLVAADERDIVRTRSNARGEDVYLYRLNVDREQLRSLFLGYVEDAESLRRQPRFYNTLTSNCTTIVFDLARRIAPGLPLDYRLLASGHFAEYAYDLGGLAPGFDYPALYAAGHINARALAADVDGTDFSAAIRAGVPGIDGEPPTARVHR